jgi:hypothetical protein
MKDIRVVKIKTWDKMKKEFKTTINNTIDCKGGFSQRMEEAMPENRIIVIEKSDLDGSYCYNMWVISNDMIEEEYTSETHPQYFI